MLITGALGIAMEYKTKFIFKIAQAHGFGLERVKGDAYIPVPPKCKRRALAYSK